jgi:RNA polymerase sigma-70 factor (ECF subfamily)
MGFEKAKGHDAAMSSSIYARSDAQPMSPVEERDCMKRIAEGDKAAFSRMVRTHMTDIYRFAYSILGDATRAEDITQEACLKLWTRAGQWTPSGKVRSWLFRITHNLCMDELRGKKPQVDIEKMAFTLRDDKPDQTARYAERETARTVNDALNLLPERQRTALMLVHYNGHTNIESAQIMGLSVDAIESLLARGRRKMKDLLTDSVSGSLNNILEG